LIFNDGEFDARFLGKPELALANKSVDIFCKKWSLSTDCEKSPDLHRFRRLAKRRLCTSLSISQWIVKKQEKLLIHRLVPDSTTTTIFLNSI
jgi:hypothetical protein